MYCSTCGVAVDQGLSYCNYCGAKLSRADGDGVMKASEVNPGSLVFGMIFVFVFGLVAITILLGVMKTVLGLNQGVITASALLSFLMMVLLEGVFIRLLLGRKHKTEAAGAAGPLQTQATKELTDRAGRVLPEPVPSVTEHTTHTFEPIYAERKSNE